MISKDRGLSYQTFQTIEKISPAGKNGLTRVRLHKQSGKIRDYSVRYRGKVATQVKSNSFWRNFWHELTEYYRCSCIVSHLNHLPLYDGPCVIDVSSGYSRPYPSDNKEWLQRANQHVSRQNPRLTLLLDLDKTLLSSSKSTVFDVPSSKNDRVFFNSRALKQLSAFQKRGHRIMVISNAFYPYSAVAEEFRKYDVDLSEEFYFNHAHQARFGMRKQKFISKYAFDKSCLLVDDLVTNRSKKTLFHQAREESPFPELVEPKPTDTTKCESGNSSILETEV